MPGISFRHFYWFTIRAFCGLQPAQFQKNAKTLEISMVYGVLL
jgi:hypothetical protein